jgi:hypothetical protein
MSPTELKMQPTIHLECKIGYLPRPYPALCSKCIMGCILNSIGLIITRESPILDSKLLLHLTDIFRFDSSFCFCMSILQTHKHHSLESSPITETTKELK